VLRSSTIAENMVRVVAGGPELAGFDSQGKTDMYVKIHFPQSGVDYPEPLDVFGLRDYVPRESWPATRTYTVRWVDQSALELAIDFVVHGDDGLAGPWAAAALPGDALIISGPGGAYASDPDADWYLFAGDESALPAIAAALESLPPQARGLAFLETGSPAGITRLTAPEGVDVRWLLRGTEAAGTSNVLPDAVRDALWPEGRVDVFAHGERGAMKALRDVFFNGRGLDRSQVSLSGYWAYGRSEDLFQAEKKEPIGKIV
jgi:NADPH-dependent ferric siderophore reductase